MERGKLKREIKQFVKFNVTGAVSVGTDYGVYFLLGLIISNAPAKGISFLCGSLVAFLMNKYWTFQIQDFTVAEVIRYVIVIAAGIATSVAVNQLVLKVILDNRNIAFVASAAISGPLVYLGQKFWVFRERK